MDTLRRTLLQSAARCGSAGLLIAAGLLKPTRLLAAEWNRPAFAATSMGEALKAHGAAASSESRDILISAPEIAENGAQVPVEIISNLPGSQSLAVFIEKNPMPLAASLSFANGALAQAKLQFKMAETSRLRVVVKTSDGKIHHANREIKVTLGGCGG